MAELAIPLIALGGLYVISNTNDIKENKKEGYKNLNTNNSINNDVPIENSYNKSENPRGKYFDDNIRHYVNANNPPDSVGSNKYKAVIGLDGEKISLNDFKHNNMQPFFGSKIRGSGANLEQSEGILDRMQGGGSQYIKKTEQAPLFKPEANVGWVNGMPNMSEFMLSRQVPSMKVSGIKPWDEKKVGPGLGLGYTSESTQAGYNAGVEFRESWQPKTVDQLRVKTNPKLTFSLDGHQGPANAKIKEYGKLGKVEKFKPDRDFVMGADRLFTTTGIEKAQAARGIEVLQDVNRANNTREYFGNGGGVTDKKATYSQRNYEDSKKQQLKAYNIAHAHRSGRNDPTNRDYGNGSYENVFTHRGTTKQPENYGYINGVVKAVISPLLDILRTTRKENVIGNARPSGNAHSHVNRGQVFNPNDKLRTTIKEQTSTLLDNNHLNVQNQQNDAYKVSDHTVIPQQRDTTTTSYSGSAGSGQRNNPMTYNAAYNQINNVNKPHIGRINQGNATMFNNELNVNIKKTEENRNNNRGYISSGRISAIPNVSAYGNMLKRNDEADNNTTDRINPDLLKAFKENPYTKSLNSWA